MKKQIDIVKHIQIGKANAIHQIELAESLGIEPSHVKSLVRKAREDGEQIISGSQGYWMAESDDEAKQFIDKFEKNGVRRIKTVKSMKDSLKIPKGQKTLKQEDESNDNVR